MKNTIVVITVIICMVSSTNIAQTGILIKNGGFETDTDGNGMADQWQFARLPAVFYYRITSYGKSWTTGLQSPTLNLKIRCFR